MDSAVAGPGLAVDVSFEGDVCVVLVTGELDLATRDMVVAAVTATHHSTVLDLGAVTFMDCAGQGCLVACRLALERMGRTLAVRGQTGQPARLLAMIAALEHMNGGIGAGVSVGSQSDHRLADWCDPIGTRIRTTGGAYG